MRVHINAAGREITIECGDTNVTPKDIAAEALALWTATDGPEPTAAAFGLTSQTSSRPQRRWARMDDGEQPEVRA